MMSHPASRVARPSMKTLPARQIETSGEAPSERGFDSPVCAEGAATPPGSRGAGSSSRVPLRGRRGYQSPAPVRTSVSPRYPTGRKVTRPASIALRTALRGTRADSKIQWACGVSSDSQRMLAGWACEAGHFAKKMFRTLREMVCSLKWCAVLCAFCEILETRSVILDDGLFVFGQWRVVLLCGRVVFVTGDVIFFA